MSALSAKQVAVSFRGHQALCSTDLEFTAGQLVGLIGPNGAGKTTLLRALCGLVHHRGIVRLGDQSLKAMSPKARARSLSYLPQGSGAHWPIRVADLVALGRLPHRPFGRGLSEQDQQAVAHAMHFTGTTELGHRAVDSLSGGERARALLARALAVESPILLVDEPTAALDPYHQLEIMEVLANYAAKPALVVAVLHDLALAARFCDRLLLLHQGALMADGTPDEVLTEEALRDSYHIHAFRTLHNGQPVVVPWERVSEDKP